jgi:hypothetical protein
MHSFEINITLQLSLHLQNGCLTLNFRFKTVYAFVIFQMRASRTDFTFLDLNNICWRVQIIKFLNM